MPQQQLDPNQPAPSKPFYKKASFWGHVALFAAHIAVGMFVKNPGSQAIAGRALNAADSVDSVIQ